jgi:hypothetical protein
MSYRLRLALILLVTVAHRAILAWATYVVHPDAGTAGIMALDILEGHRPLFMYGFNYSGSLLAYFMALSFRLFGVSITSQLLPGILFAAGWVGVSYLLFRDLFNRRAGLAAALAVAIPDWVTARYSMIPDCSYSPLFFLVTLVLWLCYRIAMHRQRPISFWVHTLVLGLIAGLALWTHPSAAAYLLCGLGILMPFFIRHRFHWKTMLPFLAGGLLFGLCLLPYLHTLANPGAGTIATWVPRPQVIQLNYLLLTRDLFPQIFQWPAPLPLALHALAQAAILLGALVWFLRILTGVGRNDRLWATLPLLFCAVYLALFLPHRMAVTNSVRYAIPVWTMLVWGITAVPISSRRRWIRTSGVMVLGCLLVYNTAGFAVNAARQQPHTAEIRANYQRAIERADALGLTQVITVGGYYHGMESQALTFLAGNHIRFSYAGDERHLANAQASDTAPQPGFAAFTPTDFAALTQSLDALGATYLVDEGPWMKLAYEVAVPTPHQRALLPEQMLVHLYRQQYGTGEDLLDRTQSSYISGSATGETALLLDLGTQRPIDGLAFLPKDMFFPHLPVSYRLEGSAEGRSFQLIRDVDGALPVHYTAGGRAYFGGEYGRIECRFAPRRVRYLRLTALRSAQPSLAWRMSELYVFEHVGEASDRRAEPVVAALQDTAFTAADRWLSAQLIAERPASAWPRSNTHLQRAGAAVAAPMRTVCPGADAAIAVDPATAEDLESILRATYGEDLSWTRTTIESYALFTFDQTLPPDSPALTWNGLTLVR